MEMPRLLTPDQKQNLWWCIFLKIIFSYVSENCISCIFLKIVFFVFKKKYICCLFLQILFLQNNMSNGQITAAVAKTLLQRQTLETKMSKMIICNYDNQTNARIFKSMQENKIDRDTLVFNYIHIFAKAIQSWAHLRIRKCGSLWLSSSNARRERRVQTCVYAEL